MLFELILKAREKDNQSMQEMIERFLPIIKKYAHRLYIEDAEQDLILFFLELLYKIPTNILLENNDGKIVNYMMLGSKEFLETL